MLALYCHSHNSTGALIQQTFVASIKNFYKKSYLTVEQFMSKVQTGDLILFQGSELGSYAVRIATSSKYDHVGMLVRANDG